MINFFENNRVTLSKKSKQVHENYFNCITCKQVIIAEMTTIDMYLYSISFVHSSRTDFIFRIVSFVFDDGIEYGVLATYRILYRTEP